MALLLLLLLAQTATLGSTNYAVDGPMAESVTAPSFANEFDAKKVDRAKWRFDTSCNAEEWHNNDTLLV